MIILVMLFNLLISVVNAWSLGRAWPYMREQGIWGKLVLYSGAVMTAIGFTIVWSGILVGAGVLFHLLSPQVLHVFMAVMPALIIIPLVCAGMIITIESWRAVFQSGQRGWERTVNVISASYNTYAEIHNLSLLPSVFENLRDSFDGDDDLPVGAFIVGLMLVAFALFGGILTTYVLINRFMVAEIGNRLNQMSAIR